MARSSSGRLAAPCLAVSGLLLVMGVAGPAPAADPVRAGHELGRQIGRLRSAVVRYARDVGAPPQAVEDLSVGFCGGLRDARFAPLAHRAAWRGPYLRERCVRPTPSGFLGLRTGLRRADVDADGEADELWASVYLAGRELPLEQALAYDRRVDDGDPERGRVQIESGRLLVHLLEL